MRLPKVGDAEIFISVWIVVKATENSVTYWSAQAGFETEKLEFFTSNSWITLEYEEEDV